MKFTHLPHRSTRRTALATLVTSVLITMGPLSAVRAQADGGTTDATADVAPQSWVAGEIRRIDLPKGRLTIRHADIPHLDMQAMTMVFTLRPGTLTPEQLKALRPGDKVEFQAEMPKGQLTVTALRRAGDLGSPSNPVPDRAGAASAPASPEAHEHAH